MTLNLSIRRWLRSVHCRTTGGHRYALRISGADAVVCYKCTSPWRLHGDR